MNHPASPGMRTSTTFGGAGGKRVLRVCVSGCCGVSVCAGAGCGAGGCCAGACCGAGCCGGVCCAASCAKHAAVHVRVRQSKPVRDLFTYASRFLLVALPLCLKASTV